MFELCSRSSQPNSADGIAGAATASQQPACTFQQMHTTPRVRSGAPLCRCAAYLMRPRHTFQFALSAPDPVPPPLLPSISPSWYFTDHGAVHLPAPGGRPLRPGPHLHPPHQPVWHQAAARGEVRRPCVQRPGWCAFCHLYMSWRLTYLLPWWSAVAGVCCCAAAVVHAVTAAALSCGSTRQCARGLHTDKAACPVQHSLLRITVRLAAIVLQDASRMLTCHPPLPAPAGFNAVDVLALGGECTHPACLFCPSLHACGSAVRLALRYLCGWHVGRRWCVRRRRCPPFAVLTHKTPFLCPQIRLNAALGHVLGVGIVLGLKVRAP